MTKTDEEETVLFTYNLTVLVELMNFEDFDRKYSVSRQYEFNCEDDEEAIGTAANIFRKIMHREGEDYVRVDRDQFCITGIMNAALGYVDSRGHNEIITRWKKYDFDNEGVMNYGSMDRDNEPVTYANNYTVWTKEMLEESRLKREAAHQAFCDKLQGQTRIYLALSKTGWKDKVRS